MSRRGHGAPRGPTQGLPGRRRSRTFHGIERSCWTPTPERVACPWGPRTSAILQPVRLTGSGGGVVRIPTRSEGPGDASLPRTPSVSEWKVPAGNPVGPRGPRVRGGEAGPGGADERREVDAVAGLERANADVVLLAMARAARGERVAVLAPRTARGVMRRVGRGTLPAHRAGQGAAQRSLPPERGRAQPVRALRVPPAHPGPLHRAHAHATWRHGMNAACPMSCRTVSGRNTAHRTHTRNVTRRRTGSRRA